MILASTLTINLAILVLAGFIGFAPADNPRLLAYVVVADPRSGKAVGGDLAAPAVKQILENPPTLACGTSHSRF